MLRDQLAATERVLEETKGMWSQTEIEREYLEKLLDDHENGKVAKEVDLCSQGCQTGEGLESECGGGGER